MNEKQLLAPQRNHFKISPPRLGTYLVVGITFLTFSMINIGISQESTSPHSTFLESLNVNVVNVEVFVTDKKGQPILDLSQKDFEIFEDKARVSLTNFQPPEGTQGLAEPTGAEAQDAGRVDRPAPDQHVAILVDNLSIHPGNRGQVLRNLEEFIKSNDESSANFLVASYDGHLDIKQPFTTDRELLLGAISGLQTLGPLGISRYAQRESILREGMQELRGIQEAERMVNEESSLRDRSDVARLLSNLNKQVDLYSTRIGDQTRTLLYEMSHLINALGVMPGRKSLIFVSEGIPMRPAAEIYHAIQRVFSDLESDLADFGGPDPENDGLSAKSAALSAIEARGGTRRTSAGSGKKGKKNTPTDGFQQIAALANSSHVSFYTIKAQGNLGGVEAEYSGDIGLLLTPDLKRVRDNNLTESLRVLADNTSGLSDIGYDAGRLIRKATTDLSSHYSLGYSPDHFGDSQYHHIKVKVKRKGAVLRYRNGYVDKPTEARIADRVSATLLLNLDDNPLDLEVTTYPARLAEGTKQWIVPIEVLIPLRDMTLLPEGSIYVGQGQLLVASLDAFGGTAPVQAFDLRIEVSAEEIDSARSQKHRARFELQMSQGPQRLAIGFVDSIAESTSFVGRSIDVGSTN